MSSSAKQVYKNPQPGQPLITTISSGCKTPVLNIKFCNLVKAFYYPNSPTIPRYSVTCIIDPAKNKEFLIGVQTIEKNEKVETIIKNETVKEEGNHITTGNLLIKFQSKEKVPVYIQNHEQDELIELEDELARGEKIIVVYDILRYTKKNTMKTEHGISFKPTCIYYYPSKPLSKKESA
jgi:uncharacterized protein (DUF1330 family)